MRSRFAGALLTVLTVTGAVLALGIGSASAHVSVSSADAAPGGFGELTFRVPSESDTARTVSLRVQLPTDTPLAFVSVKPVPGWTATVTRSPIDPPVTDDDGNEVSEAVTEVSWAADAGAGLESGQYQTFSISAGPMPDADALTLPAIQGYDDGSEVAWIEPRVDGQDEPAHPAPVLTLAAASDAAAGATDLRRYRRRQGAADAGTSGVAVTALVLAVVGVLAGGTALVLALASRRRTTSA